MKNSPPHISRSITSCCPSGFARLRLSVDATEPSARDFRPQLLMTACALAHVVAVIGAVSAREHAPAGVPRLTPSERLLAGGTARALSQALLYPADALRTLAQTRAGAPTLGELGARTLVSGCATTSSFAYAIGAIQFGTVGVLTPRLGPLRAAACGALASCVVSVPQEVIKQRLVTGVYTDFAAAVRTIWSTHGPRGFYAGLGPTAARNVPFVVCTFTAFAWMERRALERSGARELGTGQSVRIGVLSALAAGALTQPFDVVKTRMMTQAASAAVPYAGVADCVATMWRTEGPASFYAGLRQRSAYAGPLWALQFGANARLSQALLARKARRVRSHNPTDGRMPRN
jgi:solute carrier family 25 S-adenosylmethionine transporter 26